jgi:UDP-2,3-diacylglucosamine hydrolase
MTNPGCVYFVADAHLGQGSPESNRERERNLLAFLDRVGAENASLYVVGDLFDFWFEYAHAIPKGFVRVLQALGELRRHGIPLMYVGGNHDFWIGDYLERELDVPFTDGSLALQLQGRKIYLAHGDGLGPGDGGYKVLKRVLRNGFARAMFRWIHPDVGIPLARSVSHLSRNHAPKPGRTEDQLLDLLAAPRFHEGFDAVVMGHFHRPIHRFAGRNEFLVLGDWMTRRTYARLENGTFSLLEFGSERGALAPETEAIGSARRSP